MIFVSSARHILDAKKVILSLFDFSGNWSKPYKDAGYDVYCVDIKHNIDVLSLTPEDMPFDSVYGILAAPPCTDFSGSGAQYWPVKDIDGRTDYSLSMVDKVISLVGYYNPVFWALENPVGRLSTLRPQLGKPWYFNPYEFAGWLDDNSERYTKKTGLWGKFNKPEKLPLSILGPNPIMALGGKSERTKELRSMTPHGFSRAFYESNQ